MKQKELNKRTEDHFLQDVNTKISQKVKLLRLNNDFIKEAKILRKKWHDITKEWGNFLKKLVMLYNLDSVEIIPNQKLILPPISPRETTLIINLFKSVDIGGKILDKDFQQDIIDLAKKYKLYPAEQWKEFVMVYILTELFIPATYFFKLGLENYIPKLELLKVPPTLNFFPIIKENETTKEPELLVKIFDNTSRKDLMDNWSVVAGAQKKLRELKGFKKRYYPRKIENIEIEQKIKELKKQGKSDWEIQELIYGEKGGLDFGPEENRAKAKIRQIRHREKKKM